LLTSFFRLVEVPSLTTMSRDTLLALTEAHRKLMFILLTSDLKIAEHHVLPCYVVPSLASLGYGFSIWWIAYSGCAYRSVFRLLCGNISLFWLILHY